VCGSGALTGPQLVDFEPKAERELHFI